MARYVYLFAFCLLLQGLNAAVTEPSTSNKLQEALEEAQSAFANFTSSLGLDNISSSDIGDTFRNITEGFQSGLSDFVNQLQTEIQSHSGELNNVLQTANERINQTITQLQTQNPDTTRRVNEVKNQIDTGFQTLLEEARNIARALDTQTAGVRQEISDITRNVLDQASESVRNFQDRVRTAVESHQSTHSR